MSPNTMVVAEKLAPLIGALLLLLIGLLIAKFISKFLQKILHSLGFNMLIKKFLKIEIPAEEFITTLTKYILYFVVVIMALQQLGITTFALKILLLAVLAIIIVLIILAFKDLLPNIIAGILIYKRKILKVGQEIEIAKISGKIKSLTLTEIKIETKNKDTVIIPTRKFLKENYKIKH